MPSTSASASSTPAKKGPAAWTATGDMIEARGTHTATLLPDGRILVSGGVSLIGASGGEALASAELYDSGNGSWTATGRMTAARAGHTATLLPDGRVLAAGGRGSAPIGPLGSAELFDPGSGTWTATGDMIEARTIHTATLLPDGRVLVVGGEGSSGTLASAELYDPGSGIWTATGGMSQARSVGHTATLLPNGRVLVAGGFWGGSGALASAELYDPVSGSWTTTGDMTEARTSHTATLLPDGKVLVAGGWGAGPPGAQATGSAELYDPGTGSWTPTGHLIEGRTIHTATLLANGKLLVAGGSRTGSGTGTLASAELYDSGSGSWTATGDMFEARTNHTSTLQRDGKVLAAGGLNLNAVNAFDVLASAERYDPGSGT